METKDQVQEILETLAPASQNNERKMFLEDVRKFEESPSDRTAKRLEEMWGMSVDYNRLDNGH